MLPAVLGSGLRIYSRSFWKAFLVSITVNIVALAMLTPWAYRNYQSCGRLIFISSDVGCTLVSGLGVYQNPWGIGGLDNDRSKEAEAQGFRSPWSPEADEYFRKVYWEAVTSKPMGFVMAVVKRLPMAILLPQSFGYINPNKTATFSSAMAQGKDRYQIMREKPLYVLEAYWEWLAMGVISLLSLACSMYMIFRERKTHLGIVLVFLAPHFYSIGTHVLTHIEPRFVLPSMFSLLIGLAYVCSCGWRRKELHTVTTVNN